MQMCCVSGCDRAANYKGKGLCQKHYFRQWRYGTTDLVRSAKPRHETPDGYQWLHDPAHPLKHRKGGYVAEHRAVLFADIGPGPMSCALCARDLTWQTCKVDHIDNDVRNNVLSNLRPTCNLCNTRRGMRSPSEWNKTVVLEHDGRRLCAQEWSREPGVKISGRQIIARKRAGMSDYEAIFSPKKTHNGNGKKRIRSSGDV